MSNPAVPASADGSTDRLAAVLGTWSADPLLAPLVAAGGAAGGAALLVLDASGERLLHASAGAAPMRASLADASGRLHASLGLSGQIRRLGPLSGKPRIARLRLDPRGIAPGIPCQIARAPLPDGATALLVAPLGASRAARPPNGTVQAEPAPEPPAAAPQEPTVDEPVPTGRLIWRSDAEGVLTHVSGAGRGIAAALLGRSWPSICAQAEGAEAVLDALRERRTFRALPLSVWLPSLARTIALDLSGAPSGRANGALGLAGFALIRDLGPVVAAETALEPAAAASGEPEAVSEPPSEEARPQDEPATAPVAADWPPNAAVTTERRQSAEPAPELSTDEHAAFREIARALGARFAGDAPRAPVLTDTRPPALGEPPAAPAPKAVERTGTAQALTDALAGAFERLPAGVLVHRGDAILFANRRLLDLTGHADLQALRTNGSLAPLLAASAGGEDAAVMATGEGVRLAAERSNLDWDGAPASLILARAAPEPTVPAPPAADARGAKALLDGLEDGVVTLDADGHVLRLNPKAEAILAEAAPDVVGKRFASLLAANGSAPSESAQAGGDRHGSHANGASEPRAAAMPLSEGHATPLRVRIGRLLSADETPLYATLQDMAEAKRGEEEAAARRGAEEAARRRVAFFAKAGQALRAPLSRIVALAEARLAEPSGTPGSERTREDLRDIHASGGQALGQLDDLVELAEIESGRIDLAFADLPLNDLVSRCIAELQPQAARRRIVLRTSLADDLQALHADERSLRSAAIKVLGNAIRLTEAGGQVIVSTTLAEAGDIALRVRDTGSGLSPEQVDHALDPFRQPRMPGAPGDGGAGLGLTLTKALVEANRGTLRVTSRKDEGTLVEMIFPAKAASA